MPDMTSKPAPHGDETLLALEARIIATEAFLNTEGQFDAVPASEGGNGKQSETLMEMDQRLALMPAQTIFGIRAKLRRLCRSIQAGVKPNPEIEGAMVESAVCDVNRLMGISVGKCADTDLLRKGDEYVVLFKEITAGQHSVDGNINDVAARRLYRLEAEIADIPAHSLAGVVVKLHVAANASGEFVPVESGDRAARSALETVRRLLAELPISSLIRSGRRFSFESQTANRN